MAACSVCGAAVAADQRFCGACGAPIARSTGDGQRQERKIVSVVFADLVGFTARSERLDVEDVQSLLAGYHRAVRAVLERFGGTVEKFIGDAVVAVFGAPVTHEDDAERAVRAALATVQAVREIDADLHVRVGVNTGEALIDLGAVASRTEGMASGDVVNTAARLQANAPVDGVLVGEPTYAATERHVVYLATDAVVVKGKAHPVACWIAEHPRSRLPDQARDRLPFVGRAPERRALARAFDKCCADRCVRLVTITGMPGIGKSRLVAELGTMIDARAELVVWRHGRVLPYGDGSGLWALEQVVKQECGVLDSDSQSVMLDKIATAVAAMGFDEPDAVFVRRQVGVLLGVASDVGMGTQRDALTGWRMFLTAVGAQCPTVLVFDDVHWAEPVLLDCVEHFVEHIGAVPLLIIVTARPDLLERRPTWASALPMAETIELGALGADDVAELVNAALGSERLAPDVASRLAARAQGNPLFATEYARSLADRDHRAEHGERDGAIPDTVHALIAARLDHLDPDEKAFLHRAAVLGEIGWLQAVGVIAADPTVQTGAEHLLDALERKQFVRRRRNSSIAHAVEFEFLHGLVRDVAYQQIPRAVRCAAHERAAGWLRDVAADRGDLSELVASHYTVALDLAVQLGQPDAPLRVETVRALIAATRQAAARHDHAAVIRYADRALLLDPAVTERASLFVARELAQCGLGHPDHGALLAALDAAVEIGHSDDAIAVLFELSDVAEVRFGDATLAEQYASRAAELAAGLAPGPVATLGPYVHAWTLISRGSYDEAIDLCEREIARATAHGAAEAAALLMVQRGRARCARGDGDGAEESRAGAQVLFARRHPRAASAALSAASNLCMAGRIDDGREMLGEATAWTRVNAAADTELLFLLGLEAYDAAVFERDGAGAVTKFVDELTPMLARIGDLDAETASLVDAAYLWQQSLTGTQPDVGAALGAATADAHDRTVGSYGRLNLLAAAALVGAVHGDPNTARACDDYLAAWTDPLWDHGTDHNQVQVAIALAALGRRADIDRITAIVPIRGPWLEVLELLGSGHDDDAAVILTAINCGGLAQMLGQALHGHRVV